MTWNSRYKAYMATIHKGKSEEILEIVKELEALREVKVLSFGERKMIQLCEEILSAKTVKHLRVINAQP